MRLDRLVINGEGDRSFALDFHPRLTVVTGVGPIEREGLLAEIVGTLSSNRSGGHLELTDDRGRHLAVFRPHAARHMVVDIDSGTDVSTNYRTESGAIDMLAVEGLDQATAKRRMRVTASDLTTRTRSAELIHRLAACDQAIIWKIAERVQRTQSHLDTLAEQAGTSPEDLALIESVERRHQEFESAQARYEMFRRLTFYLAVLCATAAVPLAHFIGSVAAAGAILPASLITLVSLAFWRRASAAQRAQQSALEGVGVTSYLGFHLQRVNTLLSQGQTRQELMSATIQHRESADSWEKMVGDVPVAWALAHRDDIVSAARVRVRADAHAQARPVVDDDTESILAEELVVRLAEARRLGTSDESFPLILDDPFVNYDSSVKPALLELLVESSHHQQVVLLTQDDDVAAWALLEAITGVLSVVAPSGEDVEHQSAPAKRLTISSD